MTMKIKEIGDEEMKKELIDKVNNLIKITKAEFLSSKSLYQGKFIELIEEKYLLPNDVVMRRERIIKNKNKQAVIVVAITEDDKYILVAQNRINGMTTLEFPAGYIEENESVTEASLRELLEETGYVSSNIKQIDSYFTQIGIDGAIINIVVAYDCVKNGSQNLGKYEYINYDLFTLEEVEELIANNYISSAGSELAFYELSYLTRKNKIGKSKILEKK